MRYVLFGDAQSPHLLKWAKEMSIHCELYVVSSRNFSVGFDAFLNEKKRFSLDRRPGLLGWALALLKIYKLGKWLHGKRPDYINVHYITSHGLFALIIIALFKINTKLIGSAWGSDILLAFKRGLIYRKLVAYVVARCAFCTSDSEYMAGKIIELGSNDVMIFPFGLERVPAQVSKDPNLVFSNRGLESVYAPLRMLEVFKHMYLSNPSMRLIVANNGSMQTQMQNWVARNNLIDSVHFFGKLDKESLADIYCRAKWFISVPISDSVSVSVLEAMGHGCIPILSDLPANRELVTDGFNGVILPQGKVDLSDFLEKNKFRYFEISEYNRKWIISNALFSHSMEKFISRLNGLSNKQ